MSEISVIGAGYVGLVTGACFAHLGHNVTCVDIDRRKIQTLQRGEVPFHEPGLDALIREGAERGRLAFSLDPAASVPASDFVFVAVQTPSSSNGDADLVSLLRAVRSLVPLLKEGAVLVQKSTAPIGTTRLIGRLAAGRNGSRISAVANPEFLREGSAVQDFLHPDRVVIGAGEARAGERLARLFDFVQCPVMLTDPDTAEMIKYASNAFLATKISFMNEVARICDSFAVDVRAVAEGMGYDPRIGPDFLRAGLGWGGSCFPKDVKALAHMARTAAVNPRILDAARRVNAGQRRLAVKKLQQLLGDLDGAVIGLLGLSFKPHTDDMRSAASLDLADMLMRRGATVRAYDPVAMERARAVAPGLTFCDDPYELADGADALVLVTEWPEFRRLEMAVLRGLMRRPVLLDGRNFLDRQHLEEIGFTYAGFGVPGSIRTARQPLESLVLLGGAAS